MCYSKTSGHRYCHIEGLAKAFGHGQGQAFKALRGYIIAGQPYVNNVIRTRC